MIAPQELRLENWVYDSFKNREVKVWGIDSNHDQITVNYANGSGIYTEDLKYIDPIELTEDWLLKFGFKHTGGGFYTHLPSLIQACNVSDKFYNVGFKDANIGRFYYVHQIQNLYFALTGEELKTTE